MFKERAETKHLNKEQARTNVFKTLNWLKSVVPSESWLSIPYSGVEVADGIGWWENKKKAKKLIKETLSQSEFSDKMEIVTAINQVIDNLEYHIGVQKSQEPNFEEAEQKISELLN